MADGESKSRDEDRIRELQELGAACAVIYRSLDAELQGSAFSWQLVKIAGETATEHRKLIAKTRCQPAVAS